jgi:hypothetical protein
VFCVLESVLRKAAVRVWLLELRLLQLLQLLQLLRLLIASCPFFFGLPPSLLTFPMAAAA